MEKKQVTLATAFICMVSIVVTMKLDTITQQNQQFVAIEGFASPMDAKKQMNLVKTFFEKDRKTFELYGYVDMKVDVSVRSSSFAFPFGINVAMLHIDDLLLG